jgi:hypothetical protein
MGRYLDLAKQVTATEGGDDSAKIDGHTVSRIIWETEKAIVFEDAQGHFWRYLHAYRQAWPVIIGGMQGRNPDLESGGQ